MPQRPQISHPPSPLEQKHHAATASQHGSFRHRLRCTCPECSRAEPLRMLCDHEDYGPYVSLTLVGLLAAIGLWHLLQIVWHALKSMLLILGFR